jgi:glycosyltransferase involved in cell wall biosynthesis
LSIVTIGICVKNREDLVSKAIQSVAEQEYPRNLMETIIVDDGSTDRTLSVVKTSVQELGLSARIVHQKWKGLGPARNVVVKGASSKYIIWVDSDMQLARDFVKTQVAFMEEHPHVAIAKGSYGMYDTNIVSSLENIEFITTNSQRMRQIDANALGTGGSIYRVEAIRAVGGFNDSIKGSGEDAEAENRIRQAGWKLEITSAVFFEIRRSSWRSIWEEYFWHGKGSMQVVERKTVTSLYKFFPPFALFVECMRITVAYKMVQRKIAILLPLHFVFKRTAWLAGLLMAGLMKNQA